MVGGTEADIEPRVPNLPSVDTSHGEQSVKPFCRDDEEELVVTLQGTG